MAHRSSSIGPAVFPFLCLPWGRPYYRAPLCTPLSFRRSSPTGQSLLFSDAPSRPYIRVYMCPALSRPLYAYIAPLPTRSGTFSPMGYVQPPLPRAVPVVWERSLEPPPHSPVLRSCPATVVPARPPSPLRAMSNRAHTGACCRERSFEPPRHIAPSGVGGPLRIYVYAFGRYRALRTRIYALSDPPGLLSLLGAMYSRSPRAARVWGALYRVALHIALS